MEVAKVAMKTVASATTASLASHFAYKINICVPSVCVCVCKLMANSKSEHDPLMDFEVEYDELRIQLGPSIFR